MFLLTSMKHQIAGIYYRILGRFKQELGLNSSSLAQKICSVSTAVFCLYEWLILLPNKLIHACS